jgi:hypothetical protein
MIVSLSICLFLGQNNSHDAAQRQPPFKFQRLQYGIAIIPKSGPRGFQGETDLELVHVYFIKCFGHKTLQLST